MTSGPDRRVSEAALPPTASASAGRSTRRPSRARSTCSRMAASSTGVGGSESWWAAASTPDPIRNDADQRTPPATVPMASSDEPPPTSTTATVPSGLRGQRAGGAPEGQARLLVGTEHGQLQPAAVAHRVHQLPAVGGVADGRRAHSSQRVRAPLASGARLHGRDRRHLDQLARGDPSPAAQRSSQVGERAQRKHFAHAARTRLADQQASGVGADVDAGVAHSCGDAAGASPDAILA